MLIGFCGCDTRVSGQAVEMLEAIGVRPLRKVRVALLREMFLKSYGIRSCVRVSCGNGTTDARVAALKGDFADAEANHTADFRPEKLVLPKSGDPVDLEG